MTVFEKTRGPAAINLTRFLVDGVPVCAHNVQFAEDRCPLLRSNGFGQRWSCAWTGAVLRGSEYLEATSDCPINPTE